MSANLENAKWAKLLFLSEPSETSFMLLSANMHLTRASSQWPPDQTAKKLHLLSGLARKVGGYNVCVSHNNLMNNHHRSYVVTGVIGKLVRIPNFW